MDSGVENGLPKLRQKCGTWHTVSILDLLRKILRETCPESFMAAGNSILCFGKYFVNTQ